MKLEKKDIVLRLIKESDITDRYLSWFSDEKVTKYLEVKDLKKNEVLDYINKGIEDKSYFIFAICLADNGLHIGNVKIGPIKSKYCITDLVTVIGDRNYWGKRVATIAIKKAIEISFNIIGLRKISASIDEENIGSIRSYLNAGMKIESKLPNYFMHKNNKNISYSDKVYVGCTNKNFKLENFNINIGELFEAY